MEEKCFLHDRNISECGSDCGTSACVSLSGCDDDVSLSREWLAIDLAEEGLQCNKIWPKHSHNLEDSSDLVNIPSIQVNSDLSIHAILQRAEGWAHSDVPHLSGSWKWEKRVRGKPLNGVDNITVDGSSGIKMLKQIVSEMEELGVGEEWAEITV